jgi:hypothetical protein
VNCPFCAEVIKDGARRCPACKEALDEPGDAPPKSQGVSVVKVLVIVGAVLFLVMMGVGVLAALLMPALMKAKEKANRTKCANNMRQIALGAIQYSDDNRFFPHIHGLTQLDGDVHTSDTPRALRLVVNAHDIDSAELFICPSSTDRAMLGQSPMPDPATWQWGGTEAAHPPLDPLADDPRLDQTDELSYGWTRKGLTSNSRSTNLISADRAVVEETALDLLHGNHVDGWNVGQVDGTVNWLATRSQPFPGSYLTKTDGPECGCLSIKVQDDPSALR